MTNRQKIHNNLVKQICRLLGLKYTKNSWDAPSLLMFIEQHIYNKVTSSDIMEVYNNKQPPEVSMPDALLNENIFIQTIKVLTLMEVSEDKDKFEELEKIMEQQENTKELTDFDKILKGIINVPKPKE